MLLEEKRRKLDGSVTLMASFVAFCGHRISSERKIAIESCQNELKASGVEFDKDFLRLPLSQVSQSRLATQHADVLQVMENLHIIEYLPSPLVIVDPFQVQN